MAALWDRFRYYVWRLAVTSQVFGILGPTVGAILERTTYPCGSCPETALRSRFGTTCSPSPARRSPGCPGCDIPPIFPRLQTPVPEVRSNLQFSAERLRVSVGFVRDGPGCEQAVGEQVAAGHDVGHPAPTGPASRDADCGGNAMPRRIDGGDRDPGPRRGRRLRAPVWRSARSDSTLGVRHQQLPPSPLPILQHRGGRAATNVQPHRADLRDTVFLQPRPRRADASDDPDPLSGRVYAARAFLTRMSAARSAVARAASTAA
jgi:hypothetical protein